MVARETASRAAVKHEAAAVRTSEPDCAVRSDKNQKTSSWHVRLLLVQLLLVPLLFEYLRPLVQFAPKDCSCSYLGARMAATRAGRSEG
jgi:hypothetical protein